MLVFGWHPISGAHIRPHVHVDIARNRLDASIYHHEIHDAPVVAARRAKSFHQLSVFQHTELVAKMVCKTPPHRSFSPRSARVTPVAAPLRTAAFCNRVLNRFNFRKRKLSAWRNRIAAIFSSQQWDHHQSSATARETSC
jgi:hypothetical protein